MPNRNALPPTSCAYLGPSGTYTEAAALQVAAGAERAPMNSIESVFVAVASGDVSIGVVPIENLIQGPVTEVLDCLYNYAGRVVVSDMRMLAIRHAIGVKPGQSLIDHVYSKDQALKQCSKYLITNMPEAQLHETASTTTSMQAVATGTLPASAVIGSRTALEQHGLSVIADDIGNVAENRTKFAVIARADAYRPVPTGADTTLCVVHPHRDRVGLLRTLVDVISDQCGLNLSAIHSRPDTRGAFRFYLEIEGHSEDPALRRCIGILRSELSAEHVDVVVAGSYPRLSFIEPRLRRVLLVADASGPADALCQFLEASGCQVTRQTPVQCGQPWQVPGALDAVVVSVLGPRAIEVWDSLAPGLDGVPLWVDHSAVKSQVMAALVSLAPSDVEVLGMGFDFFGFEAGESEPSVGFCRTSKCGALSEEFEALFFRHGAHLEYASPQVHDASRALRQHATQLLAVALGQVASEFLDTPELRGGFARGCGAIPLEVVRQLAARHGMQRPHGLDYDGQASAVLERLVAEVKRLGDSMIEGDGRVLRETVDRLSVVFGLSESRG